jgi:ABC-type lipoprotein export system ATPase subunit
LGASRKRLAEIRSRYLGIIFQTGELVGELTALQNVALAALIRGAARGDAIAQATALLEELAVTVDAVRADDLSGGERQRVAIARALINEPPVILADEPTGSLDTLARDHVANLLFEQQRRRMSALIVVTHDLRVASLADRLIRIEGTALVEDAP